MPLHSQKTHTTNDKMIEQSVEVHTSPAASNIDARTTAETPIASTHGSLSPALVGGSSTSDDDDWVTEGSSDEDEPPTRRVPRRVRVDCTPLPRVKASRREDYWYGFYADRGVVQEAFIRNWPDKFNKDDDYWGLMNLAFRHFMFITDYLPLTLQTGLVSQDAKELIPSVVEDIGSEVCVIGLFSYTRSGLANRPLQEAVDTIARILGTKPIWWKTVP